MANKKVIRREVVVLNLPQSVPQLSSKGKNVVQSMTGNTYCPLPFPSNVPALPTVTADINALDAAESLALTKVKGSVEARDAKKEIVIKDLRAYQAYVQIIADNNPVNALAIIRSAGMDVKQAGSHSKTDFEVLHGNVSGSANLVVKAIARRASYKWQMSTDGKTWTDLPVTLTSKTTVTGLTPGLTYYFRYNGVTKNGEGSWSQVVSIVII